MNILKKLLILIVLLVFAFATQAEGITRIPAARADSKNPGQALLKGTKNDKAWPVFFENN